MDIRENVSIVKDRICKAAFQAGRNPEDILLIAVTKNVEADAIKAGIEAGLTDFGENRIQEAEGKIPELGHDVKWHFIGHLQTNKVRKAVELFDIIHSVDSLHLASEIEKRASVAGKCLPALLQVDLGGEDTKSGFSREGILEVLDQVAGFDHIRIKGLMTIPPWSEDPEGSRQYFRDLAALKEEIFSMHIPGINMEHLSMGMSHDFDIAIQEGADMIRVGTALFGARCRL
ncbi:YggS family pyridoxal phosphate-dependent enzyme [bacterium]|nr:YggS family pyridoxal phosphate-dependent enzyme [bacterium]